jgi:hypothetical protein
MPPEALGSYGLDTPWFPCEVQAGGLDKFPPIYGPSGPPGHLVGDTSVTWIYHTCESRGQPYLRSHGPPPKTLTARATNPCEGLSPVGCVTAFAAQCPHMKLFTPGLSHGEGV